MHQGPRQSLRPGRGSREPRHDRCPSPVPRPGGACAPSLLARGAERAAARAIALVPVWPRPGRVRLYRPGDPAGRLAVPGRVGPEAAWHLLHLRGHARLHPVVHGRRPLPGPPGGSRGCMSAPCCPAAMGLSSGCLAWSAGLRSDVPAAGLLGHGPGGELRQSLDRRRPCLLARAGRGMERSPWGAVSGKESLGRSAAGRRGRGRHDAASQGHSAPAARRRRRRDQSVARSAARVVPRGPAAGGAGCGSWHPPSGCDGRDGDIGRRGGLSGDPAGVRGRLHRPGASGHGRGFHGMALLLAPLLRGGSPGSPGPRCCSSAGALAAGHVAGRRLRLSPHAAKVLRLPLDAGPAAAGGAGGGRPGPPLRAPARRPSPAGVGDRSAGRAGHCRLERRAGGQRLWGDSLAAHRPDPARSVPGALRPAQWRRLLLPGRSLGGPIHPRPQPPGRPGLHLGL
jgi:hypothetical protein